jgi:hypothetical protein
MGSDMEAYRQNFIDADDKESEVLLWSNRLVDVIKYNIQFVSYREMESCN